MQNYFFRLLIIFLTICPVAAFSQAPFSLPQALQTARLNNLILKREHFNVNAGEADITTAKLRPNPSLNNQTLQLVNNKYFYDNTPWNNARNRQVWWQVTKPFQLPGQRQNKINLANSSYQVLDKNFIELERNLFFDVASKWIEVWTIESQLEVIQIAKANADTLARINELRLKNQVISQTDLFRTQLLSRQYGVQVRTVRQDLKNKKNDLRFALAISDSVEIDRNHEFLFPDDVNYDTMLNYALDNRSDLQAANASINLATNNIKLQKSLALPQPVLGAIWNPQNTVAYLGFFGTIDIPLFSRNQGEIQKSSILKQQAQQSVVTLRTQIETEMRTAYNTFLVQQDNVEKFEGIIEQSQHILDNVRYAYLRGGTTIIDFLEAQRSWLETQQQYFDAQQQYRQSYIQLLFASGMINQLAQ